MISLLADLPGSSWIGLLLPLPGLLFWLIALGAPIAMAKTGLRCHQSYRLVYDASAQWKDNSARAALLNLIRCGSGLEIIWARDGEGTGCWLSVNEGYEDVLQRLVGDVFPAGFAEADQPPEPEGGVVILRWKKEGQEIASAAELCQMDGIAGLYFRWWDATSATVAIWGPKANEVAQSLAQKDDLLPGEGEMLRCPKFVGDNPWPELPPFPPSRANPGLAAVSNLQRVTPALRVNGSAALVLGQDAENQRIGFALPGLVGMRPLHVFGHAAETVAVHLAHQAIRAGITTLFLDGQGAASISLSRRLMREVAANKVLICDVERPAQSRFRLNPLWLPEMDHWPALFPEIWLDWLRELGVTPAGLGQNAYRHTIMATVLTALVAAKRDLTLDPSGLRDALQVPDFLTLVEGDLSDIVGDGMWTWWVNEGRKIPNFDVHLRLGHLRDRLAALLDIPEYRVLWQAPYLNPLAVLNDGISLLWRLPDPRQRLQPYITSQLLGITTLLSIWPANRPVLIVLHELNAGSWIKRLRGLPMARVVLVSEQATNPPALSKQTSLLLSRLDREGAEMMGQILGIRAADLRRLPAKRLLLQRGNVLGTLDLIE
ncbi:MAG: hypothetical protein DPW09_37005 [Anaerolineae bacterium]|nr:hypothetical protein [Anaerolineae bacterium]